MTRFTAIVLSLGVLWMAGTGSLWAAEPRYGGTYRFPLSTDPPTLDPAHITDTTSHTVASEMFNGLVQYDDQLNIVPDMAERWEISPDKRTYTAICASRWPRTLRLRAMRPVWRSPIISALRPLERFWGEALQRPVAWAAEYNYNASPSARRAWDALVASKLGAPHISPLPEGEVHVRPRRMTWCRRAAVIYTA